MPRAECYSCHPHPQIDSPEKILSLYEKGLSYGEVADVLRVSRILVLTYIKNYGLPRNVGQQFVFGPVYIEREWVDGWLLGDGCISLPRDGKNAYFKHGSSREEYTQYVRTGWLRMGFTASEVHPYRNKESKTWAYHAFSRVHPTITEQYLRWYPQGIKRIPSDIKVTPASLREWYLGDGTLFQGQYPGLVMGGNREGEVDVMRSLLVAVFGEGVSKHLECDYRLTKGGRPRGPVWVLFFTERIASAFFSFIGPCPVSCYSYKWPAVMNCAAV